MKRKSGERVALEIVAAKDFNHAFEIVTVGPRKTMKHHMVGKVLGVLPASTYELMHEPDFPMLRVGSRMVVPKEQFIQWVNEHTGGGV